MGDAWLLDKEDALAAPLTRDGNPEPVHIEETDANFTIEWKGHYRIEGDAFIYVARRAGPEPSSDFPRRSYAARGQLKFQIFLARFSVVP
jgi:hypothetical protein